MSGSSAQARPRRGRPRVRQQGCNVPEVLWRAGEHSIRPPVVDAYGALNYSPARKREL